MTQRAEQSKVLAMIQAMRPYQWVKNGFVAAPLLFSHQFQNPVQCRKSILAVLSFCAASSLVYIVNDIYDRQEDRCHLVKKNRPIASGWLSIPLAVELALILGGMSLALGAGLGKRYLGMLLIYYLISFLYSFVLKHVAILDVMTLSAGFVLRILAGSLAIQVSPSHWLILCTTMISLFLGFTKRRAELVGQAGTGNVTRPVLKDYSIDFLDQVIPLVTGATILCYALYTVDERTVRYVIGSRAMLLTLPFVIYGMFRYIYLAYHRKQGQDPTQTLLRDIPTLINLIGWILTSLLAVLFGRQLDLFS